MTDTTEYPAFFSASPPDTYPDDDYALTKWRDDTLNRIDQEWGCDWTRCVNPFTGYEYCEAREHNPFTNRCAEHSPDNGGWNY